MVTENKKAPQIRVLLSPSPCHVIFINQEHGFNNIIFQIFLVISIEKIASIQTSVQSISLAFCAFINMSQIYEGKC